METENQAPGYYIWGVDSTAYGPVELPTLVNWIKDERVLEATWIYSELENGWRPAADVSELNMFFQKKASRPTRNGSAQSCDVQAGALRRIKALADMTDEHLSVLLTFVELMSVPPFTHLIRQGDPGDALYGVLEGGLRSCIVVEGQECPLANLEPGSIFGEISLFDKGPHAADVISNEESLLIRISAEAISRLGREAPAAAVALLFGLIKSIAGRVRTLTKRYQHSVQFNQRAQEMQVG